MRSFIYILFMVSVTSCYGQSHKETNNQAIEATRSDSIKMLLSYFDKPKNPIPAGFFKSIFKVSFYDQAYAGGFSKEFRKHGDFNFLVATLNCKAGGLCENERLFIISDNKLISSVDIGQMRAEESFMKSMHYQFVLDTLIELKKRSVQYKVNYSEDDVREVLFDETDYEYLIIDKEGKISPIINNLTPKREFPESSYRIYSNSELKNLSQNDLDIMRNEIFATHGYIFKTKKWKNNFGDKSWYEPKFDNVNYQLSILEKINIQNILLLD